MERDVERYVSHGEATACCFSIRRECVESKLIIYDLNL